MKEKRREEDPWRFEKEEQLRGQHGVQDDDAVRHPGEGLRPR
jgi:hypothetical protein